MPTLLDRYIIKELLGPFVFGVAAFTAILAGSSVLFVLIGEAVKYGIPVITVIQLFIYKLPNIIVYSFPMSMLLATIMAFGRLSSDQEIMAFRAAGISFSRLVIPTIIAGLTISIFTIWFNESIVPKASYSAENIFRTFRHKTSPEIKTNLDFTQYDPDTGVPIRTINVMKTEKELLKDITILEYSKGQLIRVIRSKAGKWNKDGAWEFYNGIMHIFPPQNKKRTIVLEFEKEIINIKINPYDISKRKKNIEEMTTKELRERINLKKQTGKDPTSDTVHFHMKFSIPFASLIFCILGAAVGLRPHRSSSALGLGISLVVILIYYVLLSIGMGLGLSHIIHPFLAAWTPNIIVGAFGLFLLNKLSQE
jgi:lipopolysaccharide export system permease protein